MTKRLITNVFKLGLTRVLGKNPNGTQKKMMVLKKCGEPRVMNMWTLNAFDNTLGWKRNNIEVLSVMRPQGSR